MNVFGALTFGSLIKTFIPGLVWFIAIVLLDDDLASLSVAIPHPQTFAVLHDQFLFIAVVGGIFLGLMSNIVVFMGLNDWLVREPFKRRHADLQSLYDELSQSLREEISRRFGPTVPAAAFEKYVDPELLTLHVLGVPNLSYVREQYWYHLEFQINLLFAAIALLFVTLGSPHVYSLPHQEALIRAGLSVAVLGGGAWVLWKAAGKNYSRHMAKMCSLIAAMLSQEIKDREAAEAALSKQSAVAP